MNKSSLTSAFKRMRKQGIYAPKLNLTDKVTNQISVIYKRNLEELKKVMLEHLDKYNVQHNKGVIGDSEEGLLNFLKRTQLLQNYSKIFLDDNVNKLKEYETLKKQLSLNLDKNTDNFFKDFFSDGDNKTIQGFIQYKLNKNEVFNERMKTLKELYIQNSLDRIVGEQDELKKSFLNKFVDYIEGKTETFDLKEEIALMKKTSVKEARFFARDQFCKFNKVLLIASFRNAGVTEVELITCHDAAVRTTHKKWDKKRYLIDEIPEEWYTDYNCRCGAIAVAWKDEK